MDEYREYIEIQLGKEWSITRVHQDMQKELGIECGYTTLRDYVAGLKKPGQSKVDDLYEVISRWYETSSIIITSNKQFDEIGNILFDSVLVTAILDHFVHQRSFISIEGNSYRMRERERITSTKRRSRSKKDAAEEQINVTEIPVSYGR